MARTKAKKQAQGKPPKRGLPWFIWLAITLGIVAIVTFVRIYPTSGPSSQDNPGEPKAAIIDQLYAMGYPNQEFIEEVTDTLENYGFKVDVYQGDKVTVELYRTLPKPEYGYKLIIFRAHSGLIGSESKPIMKTCIFTNEAYDSRKYPREQLNEELVQARVSKGEPFYFAISSKFITNSMKGQFDDTVIIVTGCSCLSLTDLAQAFTQKGASAYLAWNATVDLDYVDKATISLTKNLCSEALPVSKAVELTMATNGPDPKYKAVLKYYPLQSGDKTLKELIQQG